MLSLIFDQKLVISCLTSGRFLAARLSSPGNADNEMKSSPERFVDLDAIADGENRETGVFASSPQEIIEFNVCITVVAIFHISAFAKKSVRLVEKQDNMTTFRRVENAAEILLCFANVFGDYAIQINPV
jgi:hypothetical protein